MKGERRMKVDANLASTKDESLGGKQELKDFRKLGHALGHSPSLVSVSFPGQRLPSLSYPLFFERNSKEAIF